MTPLILYRIASGLLLFFAAAHTFGLLRSKNLPPAAKIVRASMNKIRFKYLGRNSTWGGFYLGFGLLATVFLLLSSALAWALGDLVQFNPASFRFVAWAFFLSQAANCYLSWKYFFAPPGIIASLVVVCLGLAAWQL